jgi:hypothetical protein
MAAPTSTTSGIETVMLHHFFPENFAECGGAG